MVADQESIERAADLIKRGELVAFPTETVYGLGADALNANAVAKVFELKGRPSFDPLIVHVLGIDDLFALVKIIPREAAKLMKAFWPGPLSIVFEKRSEVPDIVTAGLQTIAVRSPAHPVARSLIQKAKTPIAAPSANRFGKVSPTTAIHVREQFGRFSPMTLDGGSCQVGIESTVVSFVEEPDGQPVLLRHGGVTREEIESVVGMVSTRLHSESRPSSPGQLIKHYAPSVKLTLSNNEASEELIRNASAVAYLAFKKPPNNSARFAKVEILSERGCLREAAANLFSAIRRLDNQDVDLIVADIVEEQGLGCAIMDRLRRAAAS